MMSQTLRLLEACLLRFQPHLPHLPHLPAEVSASHCRGYQKGSTEELQGNHAAHKAAKRAALQSNDMIGVATLVLQIILPEIASYTEKRDPQSFK